jgi:hypothetical protein
LEELLEYFIELDSGHREMVDRLSQKREMKLKKQGKDEGKASQVHVFKFRS